MRWQRVTLGGVIATGAAVACGGSSVTNNSYCAAGTAPVNGVCVALDASADGGPQGDDGPVFDSTSGLDVASSQDAASDSSGDSSVSADDPCPATPVSINCSTSCGGVTATCANLACPKGLATLVTIQSGLPFIIRTPSHPVAPPCGSCATDAGPIVYPMLLSIDFSSSATANGVLINVDAPWHLGDNAQCAPGPVYQCMHVTAGEVVIWTDDASAPARDVVISQAPAGVPAGQCN